MPDTPPRARPRPAPQPGPQPRFIELGRMSYAEAYRLQLAHHGEVLSARESAAPDPGRILMVEHDPVITVTRRAGEHLLATRETLASLGVAVEPTDRGGDITYHGPGQLVVYPIIDLNALNLRLVSYMRLLESVVIDTLNGFGIAARRDEGATGVWVDAGSTASASPAPPAPPAPPAKIAAMGVRVRKWITMHGLALNVDPDLTHFDLIVPCGLHGRTVTSMKRLLGEDCPTLDEVAGKMREVFTAQLASVAESSASV